MMRCCKIPSVLAMLAAIYILASIYYMVMTRNIGTPFRDSLDEKQLEIKAAAVKKRSGIFYTGTIVAILIVLLFGNLFNNCK